MIRGLVVIMAALALGLLITAILPFGFPAAVVGIFVLLGFMHMSPRYHADLDRAAAPLLRFLPLFFIPAGVGIINHRELLAAEWHMLSIVLIVSTALGLLVTSIVFALLHDEEDLEDD